MFKKGLEKLKELNEKNNKRIEENNKRDAELWADPKMKILVVGVFGAIILMSALVIMYMPSAPVGTVDTPIAPVNNAATHFKPEYNITNYDMSKPGDAKLAYFESQTPDQNYTFKESKIIKGVNCDIYSTVESRIDPDGDYATFNGFLARVTFGDKTYDFHTLGLESQGKTEMTDMNHVSHNIDYNKFLDELEGAMV